MSAATDTSAREVLEALLTRSQIIKANWKNAVRFYFQGSSLSELKAFVKVQIEKEVKSYEEWQIRRSTEFKDAVTNKLY